jgi:hypothetical protein
MSSLRIFILFLFLGATNAQAKLCNPLKETCHGHGSGSSTKPAYPSKSSGIRINPSAVPTEDAFGIEALVFDGAEFAIVKGTGRIGAAISASNGEETFFGPPGFDETTAQFLQRKIDGKKYKSQKINLATSFALISNHREGLQRFDLNLGVAGKYHKEVKKAVGGGGISGVAGPITFGYARGQDVYAFDNTQIGGIGFTPVKYQTESYSGGIYLDAFAFDYSRLKMTDQTGQNPIYITLLTSSLMLKRWILTLAQRKEDSPLPDYDFATKSLVVKQIKTTGFGGVQFAVTETLQLGVFYNYYLLHEADLGVTFFF